MQKLSFDVLYFYFSSKVFHSLIFHLLILWIYLFYLMHFSVNFNIWVILNWISIDNLCFLEYTLTFFYFLRIPNFMCVYVFCLFACFNSILDVKTLNSVMFLWRMISGQKKANLSTVKPQTLSPDSVRWCLNFHLLLYH